jgi:hypothetical protein
LITLYGLIFSLWKVSHAIAAGLALQPGDGTPDEMQRLLNFYSWDAGAMRSAGMWWLT